MKRGIVLCVLVAVWGVGYGQVFTDESAARGLTVVGQTTGVGFGDYDNDGDEDFVLCNFSGGTTSLYTNNGSGVFTNAPLASSGQGAASTPAWFDYDGDGDQDLLVTAIGGASELWRNDGGGAFANQSSLIPVADGDWDNVASPVIGDFDRNGSPDLYLPIFSASSGPNKLFLNSFGVFADGGSGDLLSVVRYPRSANALDYDNDGDMDIYITSDDGGVSPALYRNDGSGGFTDVAGGTALLNTGQLAKGSAWGDLDNDGDMDLVITNTNSASKVIRNDGGTWTEITGTPLTTGLVSPIAPVVLDYDNDGDLDVFFNGHLPGGVGTGAAALFRNDGGFTFVDVTSSAAPVFASQTADGSSAAAADIDNDGDMDLVRTSTNRYAVPGSGASYIYVNGTNNSNWLKVRVVGMAADRQAFGAKVEVFAAGTTTRLGYRQIMSQNGYLQMNSLVQHFGVPSTGTYDVKVTFLNGGVAMRSAVAPTQTLTIAEFVSTAARDWSLYR